MPKLKIARSIEINASPEKVFNVISDFHQWQPWSPWLIMEEGVKVEVDMEKKHYSWKGERVGAGEMKITSEEAGKRLDIDLTFLTPYKSHAKVSFDLQPKGKKTIVTWHMVSSLPFFMFWMKKMMMAFLSSDYDRGLSMLKEYVEEGKVSSKLEIVGEQDYEGMKYIGYTRTTSFDKLGGDMSQDIQDLSGFFQENNIELAGKPVSIYHKWEMTKNRATYTTAFPVKDYPEISLGKYKKGEIPAAKVFTVRHTGPYKYLGNLWSLGMNLQQNKVFKPSKKFHPFEYYVNTPGEVADNELITEVRFGVK